MCSTPNDALLGAGVIVLLATIVIVCLLGVTVTVDPGAVCVIVIVF